GVQPPVELEDDGQEPWLARGAGRALQRIPCGAGPAGHDGLGGELPRPPAVSGRRGPSTHGREEWARPESARQHRILRMITRSTARVWGCVGGLDWRDAACSCGRRNLVQGLPCGGREWVWDEGRG
ncbi:unnamed protein product, partial [Ectocarpus sp. 12 AP-2014]